jgi:hypothetical protein
MTGVGVPSAPTAAEIARIAALPDAATRNLWITWSYYQLNQAMNRITGEADLTWCGFAVWASKTAGTFIREEEAGPIVEAWVTGAASRTGGFRRWLAGKLGIHRELEAGATAGTHGSVLAQFAARELGDVAKAIGDGNQDVFGHIAPPFAKLIALWDATGGQPSADDRRAFLASLDDPADPQREYLTRAFAATFDAIETADARTRAQRMLEANALIGCAEQTRVQPFIAQSMNRPVRDLFGTHLKEHLRARFPAPIASLLHVILRDLGRALEEELQLISTRWMMRLVVPGGALRLGENVPPLPDGRMYPDSLASLDAPQPEGLMADLQATDASRCAARDWVSYPDRMRYIGVLFRSRQQDRPLWEAPFTDRQVEELRAGRRPTGPL